MKKISLRNPLLLFTTAVVWGVAFVAQSVGMDYVGPFTFNFARCILGALVLVPCMFLLDKLNGKKKNPVLSEAAAEEEEEEEEENREKAKSGLIEKNSQIQENGAGQQTKKTLLLGGICCGAALFVASNLQQFGIQYTSVGKAGFITAMYIVLVPVLSIFLKKRAGLRVWCGVALAVAGLYLLCMTDGISVNFGDVLLLLCAFVFAIHILVVDYFSPKVDGVRMSCIQFLVCGLLSGIGMLLTEQVDVSAMLQAWLPITYAGVMSCAVGYTLQIIGQKGMNPTVASLILSLESVVSVLAGWILLGQSLSPREIGGCVLMFAAIILAQLPEREAV